MTARVFVPMTDDMMEAPDGRGTPLVPYHPDRPCWRFDPPGPGPATGPGNQHRGIGRASPARRIRGRGER